MKDPTNESCLSAMLAIIGHTMPQSPGCAPVVATRVCAIARSYRRLNEAGCNRELSASEERKMGSLAKRADTLLAPYGLKIDNPYGLCMYVGPIGKDWLSLSELQVVA
jgi:hypothetical protein